MSVIIKGIEMPKRHLFEAFVAIGDGQIVVKDLEKNKLFEGKIEEVRTPHGRLIDADELTKHMRRYYPSIDHLCRSQHVVTKRDIDNAPTITEAEASE